MRVLARLEPRLRYATITKSSELLNQNIVVLQLKLLSNSPPSIESITNPNPSL
jgi:hypothetical protein